ncbi:MULTISPECIES: hypothetical protein [unclassified Mameliella]|uniref:hypothetical protein n=1 Tax=unclassified Mameliella TaxID=2630630 RepID=UPI00273FC105|nr:MULTISPECIES: hypothetical protein [unclassified Mameliella]
MEIAGRADEPWDALFIFHFLSSQGDQVVAEKLQELILRKTNNGLEYRTPIIAGKRDAPFRVLGRFVEKKECLDLLSAWNKPDGEYAFMCYAPNHGIATVRDGRMDWWALICFYCSNAGIAGALALSERSAPNRLLNPETKLQERLIGLLPERPFPMRM